MKITLLTTGGTIASVESAEGYVPAIGGEQLLEACPMLQGFEHEVRIVDLFSKDSSNMHPADWLIMAKSIREHATGSDAIIVLHGTDTLAWSASALSYLLNGLAVPVILTGSMLVSSAPDSDVPENIYAAFQFAVQMVMYKRRGVSVAFADKLFHGPKISKIDSHRKDAFASVDYPLLGEMKDKGDHKIAWLTAQVPVLSDRRPWKEDQPPFETEIALLPLFPGFKAKALQAAIDRSPKAVVVEGYGSGGVPFMGENLLPALESGIAKGIPIVLRTQSFFGGTEPALYEVGQKALSLGVLSAHDMTRESLMTKLMFLLPCCEKDRLATELQTNFCDDLTDPVF